LTADAEVKDLLYTQTQTALVKNIVLAVYFPGKHSQTIFMIY